MILEFNQDPNATPEQKIQSLKENVQLALNEQQTLSNNLYKALLKAFGVDISKLRGDFTSFADQMTEITTELSTELEGLVETVEQATFDVSDLKGRMETAEGKVETLEGKVETLEGEMDIAEGKISALETKIPAAPASDGAYVLKVTVSSGTATYAWVSAT